MYKILYTLYISNFRFWFQKKFVFKKEINYNRLHVRDNYIIQQWWVTKLVYTIPFLDVSCSISSSSSSPLVAPPTFCIRPGICPDFNMASNCCTSSSDLALAIASWKMRHRHSKKWFIICLLTRILAMSSGVGPEVAMWTCFDAIGSPGTNLEEIIS